MGTSLIRNSPLLRPYSRTMPLETHGGPRGGGLFLMSKVPLHKEVTSKRDDLTAKGDFTESGANARTFQLDSARPCQRGNYQF